MPTQNPNWDEEEYTESDCFDNDVDRYRDGGGLYL